MPRRIQGVPSVPTLCPTPYLGRADGWGVGVCDVLVLLDCAQQKQQKGGWFAFRREVEVVAMFEWRASSFEDDE